MRSKWSSSLDGSFGDRYSQGQGLGACHCMRPIGLSLKPQVALLTLASVWKMQMMAIKKSGFGNRTSVLLLTRTGTLAKLLNLSVFHFPHL